LERAKRFTGSTKEIRRITTPAEAKFEKEAIDCLDLNLLSADLPIGKVSPEAGNAAFQYLAKAISLANAKEIDAICTAPLNKEALQKGGHYVSGTY
jgi:4-hydroxythreonine-4-phosphate dehydrogenase